MPLYTINSKLPEWSYLWNTFCLQRLNIWVIKLIFLNGWTTAKAINGDEIRVKIIPLKRKQSNLSGVSWVEVGKQVEFESGEKCSLNLDGKSFYTELNKLYKLKS